MMFEPETAYEEQLSGEPEVVEDNPADKHHVSSRIRADK
ncbi:Uncharacterised protein [Providencia stuartii]|nr:Uncharacterised protein [Providencia stuartii]